MSDAPTIQTCGCGRLFACGAATGRCWCFDRPAVLPVPDADAACLCPDCLAKAAAAPLVQVVGPVKSPTA